MRAATTLSPRTITRMFADKNVMALSQLPHGRDLEFEKRPDGSLLRLAEVTLAIWLRGGRGELSAPPDDWRTLINAAGRIYDAAVTALIAKDKVLAIPGLRLDVMDSIWRRSLLAALTKAGY